jgi:hypothetical protein
MDTPSRYVVLTRASRVAGTGCVNGVIEPTVNATGSISGTMSSYDRMLAPFLSELIEGGVVIDKWSIPDPLFSKLVISGPMCSAMLADDAVDPCPSIPSYMLAPGGLEGGFKDLAAVKVAKPTWGGLDLVSVKSFTAMWREAGARIGKRVGNVIQWEDGAVDPVPPKGSRVPLSCDDCTRK